MGCSLIFTPQPSYPQGMTLSYSLNRSLFGLEIWSGQIGGEKKTGNVCINVSLRGVRVRVFANVKQ